MEPNGFQFFGAAATVIGTELTKQGVSRQGPGRHSAIGSVLWLRDWETEEMHYASTIALGRLSWLSEARATSYSAPSIKQASREPAQVGGMHEEAFAFRCGRRIRSHRGVCTDERVLRCSGHDYQDVHYRRPLVRMLKWKPRLDLVN